ncbi:MAG: hypothetical protein AYK18_04415 [Theionarchaea archaeon DG-70]|nr:MAG: hypothetical protein AYK18_04415 [Theionarchaea archaeon DG-70]
MLEQLAELLRTRKGEYILFIGAGASLSAGSRTTKEIVEDVVETYKLNSGNLWDCFCDFLRKHSKDERFDVLSRYFENMEPSLGYERLVNLIEEGYFKLVLTTNFDFMLEEALKRKTELVLHKDYFVCVVGAEEKSALVRELEDRSMIRIVKLHGDYKKRILPFTEEETSKFEENLEKSLKELTKRGIVFVGYSGMDRDVLNCLSDEGEPIWWVNPRKVTADKSIAERHSDEYQLNEEIYRIIINRKSHDNFIWGENGKSDIFFKNISNRILLRDINRFCNLFKFGATKYRKMKDLFEPPNHYEEMKRKLEEYGVLLILGEPHLGKTFTALNLLYDYYVKGFNVSFKSELRREKMRWEMMYQWEDLLVPHTVIYFEDPFGRTEPENIQIFRSELGRIIKRIQNSESMVIITSRLNIFKKIADIEEFPMIVELMKHNISYDLEKRKRIIDRYAAVYKPAWKKLLYENLDGKTLKEYIAEELTEPHNIDLFFEKSLKTDNMQHLRGEVKESKDILEAFKQEIMKLNLVEKIFFYICYIFERRRNLEITKNSFSYVLKDFKLDPNIYDFNRFIKEYDFRVETYQESRLQLKIKFSHPMLSKAIRESFEANVGIIGNILLKLAKDESIAVRQDIVYTIGKNLGKLSHTYRELLFELAKDDSPYVRQISAQTIGKYLDKLPDKYGKLLFELAKDDSPYVRHISAETIGKYLDKLPDKYRELLFEFVKDENLLVRLLVAKFVGGHFRKLPDKYRGLLLELAKDDSPYVRLSVVNTIGKNLDKLPDKYRKLLFELARDKSIPIRWFVSHTVADNFEKLPDEYRELLFELAKDKNPYVREGVSYTVADNFEKLPDKYRELLFELAKDENVDIRRSIAYTAGYNFEKLPDKYRGLLFKLAKDENVDIRRSIAYTVRSNFEKLPDKYRELLFKLAKDENANIRKSVVLTICRYFKKLPEKYRRILKKSESDVSLLNLLREWVKEHEKDEWAKEITNILKRELDL